jgi:ComF family protein
MPLGSFAGEFDKQVQQVAQAALNLLFPPRCAGCGKPGFNFCAGCEASLAQVGPVVCTICGEPLSWPGLCSHCEASERAFRRVRSAFRFEGPLRQAVHALKYEGRRNLARPLADLMGAQLGPPRDPGVLLCAVPLHPVREAQRGYNQSNELALHLARLWDIGCLADKGLQRVRATEQQVGLDLAGRQANVKDAFDVGDRCVVQGRVIVLVDDVCTTGATLDACAQALLRAGASIVDGVTLARQV